MVQITQRPLLTDPGALPVHPVLARVYGARGISHPEQLELTLKRLLPWQSLKGITDAVELLLPVVLQGKKIAGGRRF